MLGCENVFCSFSWFHGLFGINIKELGFLRLFTSARQTGIYHLDVVLSPNMSAIYMLFRLAMSGIHASHKRHSPY